MKKNIIEFLLWMLGGIGLLIVYFLYQNPDIRPYIDAIIVIGLLIVFYIQMKGFNEVYSFFDRKFKEHKGGN